MIPIPAYHGKKVGVFGLGKAGRAAVAALEAGGASVFADDDKSFSIDPLPSPPPEGGGDYRGDSLSLRTRAVGLWPERVEKQGEGQGRGSLEVIPYSQWPWETLTCLVLSPGVPLTHPVVAMAHAVGVPVMGEIELLQQACPGVKKIGITGTNGKSTTTALIGYILTAAGMNPQVGGNLGTPALALSASAMMDDRLSIIESSIIDHPFVLEMSSFQLDLMQTVRFNVAVWLNITPDHLDRHGDMEGYIAAKRHIFDRQQADDVAIIGIDDAYSESVARQLVAEGTRTVIPITVKQKAAEGVEVKRGRLRCRQEGVEIDLSGCKGLKGEHNWQNAAAAYAACRHLGVAPEVITAAMHSFSGLAHRMEWVMQKGGVIFVNDSKATNADSTARALAAYPENIYWIAGGRPKAGGIAGLAPFFPRIRHAYLLGEAEAEFAATLEGHVPATRCGTLEAATRKASADALKAGAGVVLLSPACASWDQWPNFEARGEAFKEYILQGI